LGFETFRARVLEAFERVKSEGVATLPFDPESPPDEEPPRSADRALPRIADVDAILKGDAPRGPGLVPRSLPVVGDDRGERFRRTNVHPQKQAGFVAVTVTVPLGDLTSGRLRVLALLARSFSDGSVRTTAGQNLLLRWVRAERVDALHALLV